MQRTKNLGLYLPPDLTPTAKANLQILDQLGAVLSPNKTGQFKLYSPSDLYAKAADGCTFFIGGPNQYNYVEGKSFTVACPFILRSVTIPTSYLELKNIGETSGKLGLDVPTDSNLHLSGDVTLGGQFSLEGTGEFRLPEGGGTLLTQGNVELDQEVLEEVLQGLVGKIFVKTQYVIITEEVKNNGSINLQYAPATDDIAVDVRGGMPQFPGFDFTIESNLLVFNQATLGNVLSVGDILRVMYNVSLV